MVLNQKECFEKYVPQYGNAETVGGEILRAVNHLFIMEDEEGERLGCSDFAEAIVNPAGRFIYRKIDDEHVRSQLARSWGAEAFSKLMPYEKRLRQLFALIWQWICEHPEVFETPNEDIFEDELECELDEKNAVGFNLTREFAASLMKGGKRKHR